MKFLFLPISIIVGLLAGLIGKKIFEQIWGLIDDQEPPDAKHRDVEYAKLAGALLLEERSSAWPAVSATTSPVADFSGYRGRGLERKPRSRSRCSRPRTPAARQPALWGGHGTTAVRNGWSRAAPIVPAPKTAGIPAQ